MKADILWHRASMARRPSLVARGPGRGGRRRELGGRANGIRSTDGSQLMRPDRGGSGPSFGYARDRYSVELPDDRAGGSEALRKQAGRLPSSWAPPTVGAVRGSTRASVRGRKERLIGGGLVDALSADYLISPVTPGPPAPRLSRPRLRWALGRGSLVLGRPGRRIIGLERFAGQPVGPKGCAPIWSSLTRPAGWRAPSWRGRVPLGGRRWRHGCLGLRAGCAHGAWCMVGLLLAIPC